MRRLLLRFHRQQSGTSTLQGVGLSLVGVCITLAAVWVYHGIRAPAARNSNQYHALHYKSSAPAVLESDVLEDTAEPNNVTAGGSNHGGNGGSTGNSGGSGGSGNGGVPPIPEKSEPKYRIVVTPKNPPIDDPSTPINESLYECSFQFFVQSEEGEKELLTVRGSCKPDNPAIHGTINPGRYSIQLGFHNRSGNPATASAQSVAKSAAKNGAAIPTEADLVVKSGHETLRPALIVSEDGTVGCTCEDPAKSSMNLVHIHNGFAETRDSVGGMTIHPSDWPTLMQTFLDQYPQLSDWYQSDSQQYFGTTVGSVDIKEKAKEPKYRLVVTVGEPPANDPRTNVDESLYEAEYKLFSDDGTGEKEVMTVRGTARPDDTSQHGSINAGTYPLHLGFHKRNGLVPTQSDLVVKNDSTNLRPCLVVNRDQNVPCTSGDPNKTTMNAIHVHNGFRTVRGSEGCLTVNPDHWPQFIQHFIDTFPTLSDWFTSSPRAYFVKEIGTLEVVRKKEAKYRLQVSVGTEPVDDSATTVNESLYEAEYTLFVDEGTGEKELMKFRGTARPDDTSQHGSINAGTYSLHLGFHKRSRTEKKGNPPKDVTVFLTPTTSDLVVKSGSEHLRPALIVNRDRSVPCTSGNPSKTTMSAIHVHNGFNNERGSEGCLTVSPGDWPGLMQTFLDKYPALSDWYDTKTKAYFVKEIGTLEVIRPTTTPSEHTKQIKSAAKK